MWCDMDLRMFGSNLVNVVIVKSLILIFTFRIIVKSHFVCTLSKFYKTSFFRSCTWLRDRICKNTYDFFKIADKTGYEYRNIWRRKWWHISTIFFKLMVFNFDQILWVGEFEKSIFPYVFHFLTFTFSSVLHILLFL